MGPVSEAVQFLIFNIAKNVLTCEEKHRLLRNAEISRSFGVSVEISMLNKLHLHKQDSLPWIPWALVLFFKKSPNYRVHINRLNKKYWKE